MASLGPEHVSRVRILYKAILRLHKGMPPELQALGDQYVKDEFKRHRDAELQFVPMFMNSWTDYAITLAKQMGAKEAGQKLGLGLSACQINHLSDDQIGQLYELFQETQKPVDPDNKLGENPRVNNVPDS